MIFLQNCSSEVDEQITGKTQEDKVKDCLKKWRARAEDERVRKVLQDKE